MGRKLLRSNKRDSGKVKLVHTTLHIHPLVRAELERIAKQNELSVSKVGAAGLEEWIQGKLHKQQEVLMYPIVRQVIQEELQVFGNRLVFFLLRIAIASEQARILITEALKRLLFLIMQLTKLFTWLTQTQGQERLYKKELEASPIETLDSVVAKSYDMARANVFRKSTEMKSMLAEWEDWNKTDEAKKKHD